MTRTRKNLNPLRAVGVWKTVGDDRTLLFSVEREPTEAELQSISDFTVSLLSGKPATIRNASESVVQDTTLASIKLRLERVKLGQGIDIDALIEDIDFYLSHLEKQISS